MPNTAAAISGPRGGQSGELVVGQLEFQRLELHIELFGLAGENVLRALQRAEQVSARLKKARPASVKTIQQLDKKTN